MQKYNKTNYINAVFTLAYKYGIEPPQMQDKQEEPPEEYKEPPKEPEFINVFPRDHIISKWINTFSKLTDAYSEYHLSSILWLLSTIAERRVVINITPKERLTNLWFLNVGISSISRKSTATSFAKDFVDIYNLANVPDDFSPEGLIEGLERKPQACFYRDEFGGFLKELNRHYKLGLEELFCKLFDCPEKYTRKLRKEEINLENVYLTMLSNCTPESLASVEEFSLDSGFLARFLFTFPERYRPRQKQRHLSEEDKEANTRLFQELEELRKNIQSHERIEMSLSDEAFEVLDNWQEEMEEFIQRKDETGRVAKFFDRAVDSAIKIASLIELSKTSSIFKNTNNNKNNKNSKNYRNSTPNNNPYVIDGCTVSTGTTGTFEISGIISKNSMQIALFYVQNYFLYYALKLIDWIQTYKGKSKLEKVYETIKQNNEITRSEIIRKTRFTAKELDELLDTLLQGGLIYNKVEESNGVKPVCYYYPLYPDKEFELPLINIPDLPDFEVNDDNNTEHQPPQNNGTDISKNNDDNNNSGYEVEFPEEEEDNDFFGGD